MTVYFVSRHAGAVDWARLQGLAVDRIVPHIDAEIVQQCDTVIGNLPCDLAAEVVACGAEYWHLSVRLPTALRGKELNAAELLKFGASLRRLYVIEAS